MNSRLLLGFTAVAALLALAVPRAKSNPKPPAPSVKPLAYTPRPANSITFTKDRSEEHTSELQSH